MLKLFKPQNSTAKKMVYYNISNIVLYQDQDEKMLRQLQSDSEKLKIVQRKVKFTINENKNSKYSNGIRILLTTIILLIPIFVFYVYIQWNNSKKMNNFDNNQDQVAAHKMEREFMITPQVWMFEKNNPKYLDQLMTENNRRFASLSNFKVNTLSMSNYTTFLSKGGNLKINNVLKQLKEKSNNGDQNLKKQFYSIQKQLILFSILYEKGGVIIDGSLTLTENFDWVHQIENNIYVNRGNIDAKPQVVGFYSPLYSSEIKKQNKSLSKGMEEVDKFMVLIPAIQNYFLAAKEGAEFIGRVLDEMIAILLSPQLVVKGIAEKKYKHYNFDGKDVYNQYIYLAGQRILQAKQRQLDRQNKNKNKQNRNFAIDFYGLFLINCYYGPYKTSVIFKGANMWDVRIIQNTAKYDLQEYQASVGPIKYLQITPIYKQLNEFLTRIRDDKVGQYIIKESFIQKMYFPEANQSFIFNNPEKGLANLSAPCWNNLTKIIWVFWDSGLTNAPFQTLLFIQNLKNISVSSGFEVKQVNNSNLADYLDTMTLNKIDFTLKNYKIQISNQTKSDLVRLAIIYKHGGIYFDCSVIALESFDWLIKIAQFRSQYIFNRYGELPSVVMFWNANNGGFFEWEVDYRANTKQGYRYSFENGIIAAVKQSELIKEWFDLLSQLILKPIQSVLQVFDQCNISSYQWVHQNHTYLLAMDSMKCVISRRQSWIVKYHKNQWRNGMAYYGLWSFSSYFGPFKIRGNMNLANMYRYRDNPFFTRYSQEYVEGLIGKMHFVLKFTKDSRHIIPTFIKKNFGKLEEESHSQSLFRKYYYNAEDGRFEKINGTQIVWIKNNK